MLWMLCQLLVKSSTICLTVLAVFTSMINKQTNVQKRLADNTRAAIIRRFDDKPVTHTSRHVLHSFNHGSLSTLQIHPNLAIFITHLRYGAISRTNFEIYILQLIV